MSRAVMQQALEVLSWTDEWRPQGLKEDAIAALKQALAEPEQPVAYSVGRTLHWHEGLGIDDAQLFAAPTPRKPIKPNVPKDAVFNQRIAYMAGWAAAEAAHGIPGESK